MVLSDLSCLNDHILDFHLLQDQDLELFCQLYGSAKVMKYIVEPLTERQLFASFRRAVSFNQDELADKKLIVARHQESALSVGIVGVTLINASDRIFEFGIMLLPDFYHKGLAEQISRRVVSWLVSSCNARRIVIEIDTLNIAARKIAERIGFKPDCENSRYFVLSGDYYHE